MATRSAGILLFRSHGASIEVLLVHLGGPLWAKKDAGAWSIPKGLVLEGEDEFTAANREFTEETGLSCPQGKSFDLGDVKMKSGKIVRAWAIKGEVDINQIKSNLFTLEWPPRSGKQREFPEIDRGAYFTPSEALLKVHAYQQPFIKRLLHHLEILAP